MNEEVYEALYRLDQAIIRFDAQIKIFTNYLDSISINQKEMSAFLDTIHVCQVEEIKMLTEINKKL